MLMGTFDELLVSSSDFAQLIEDIHRPEREENSSVLSTEKSINSSISVDENVLKDSIPAETNIETKKEGSVGFRIFFAYMKAGVGLVFGSVLLFLVLGLHQVSAIGNYWYLAIWSDDQTHRHLNLTSCSTKPTSNVYRIQAMTDLEWSLHQKEHFQIFSGMQYYCLNH